jgi:hypothetical protein
MSGSGLFSGCQKFRYLSPHRNDINKEAIMSFDTVNHSVPIMGAVIFQMILNDLLLVRRIQNVGVDTYRQR